MFVGSRGKLGAKGLWHSLPAAYRQCAVLYTNFWRAYAEVFPSERHQAVGKSSGKTNYIEFFNCTLRQRVSRLVRSTLSFSKKLENHIGAIWTFVHHYNASLYLEGRGTAQQTDASKVVETVGKHGSLCWRPR